MGTPSCPKHQTGDSHPCQIENGGSEGFNAGRSATEKCCLWTRVCCQLTTEAVQSRRDSRRAGIVRHRNAHQGPCRLNAAWGIVPARAFASAGHPAHVGAERAINDFDREGVTASRIFGVQRQVRLNPRYFALAQLRELLLQLSEALPEERHAIELLRRRPRRAGEAV